MSAPIIRSGQVFRGTPFAIMDLLQTLELAPAVEADIESFDLRVFDLAADGPPQIRLLEDDTVPTGFIFDTLQSGNGWSQGGAGFNWRYVVDGAITRLWEGGKTYHLEFKFNTTDQADGPLFLQYDIYVVPVQTDAPPPE